MITPQSEPDRITNPKQLERQLFAEDFVTVVAALSSYRGKGTKSLDSILGNRIDEVLSQGLDVLDQSSLRALLDNPSALVELQERVFLEGDDYWTEIIRGTESRPSESMMDGIASAAIATQSDAAAHVTPTPKEEISSKAILNTLATLVGILLLCVCLLGQGYLFPTPNPIAFVSPDATENLKGSSLLSHLADGMLSLRQIDQNEAEFAQRVAHCGEACSLMLRFDSKWNADLQQELTTACQNWLTDLATVTGSTESLENRTQKLNNLLNAIGSKLKTLGTNTSNDQQTNV